MIKKLLSSQLHINMASGMATTVVNIAVIAASYPIYLHFLGYEKYGVWLVLATVLSFAQLGNLGIGQAVMKLVAEEHGREDIESVQRYITTALVLLCLSGSFVLALVLAFKSHIIAAFKLSDENARMAFGLLPYIGILSIYVFIVQALNAVLSGLGRMDIANYIQSAGRIVTVATAGSLLYSGRGIESLLIGNALAYTFIHITSLIFIWRIAHVRFLRIDNLSIRCCKRLLGFGGGVFGGSVVAMLGSPFHKLMLSRYAGVSSIPVYEIVYNGSMQIRSLFEVGLRALMPEISRISANMTTSAKDKISQLNRHAMKFIIMFGFPIYAAIFIFATPLLRIWLRDQFLDSMPLAFQIMLVATFISLLGVPFYYLLLGMGHVSTVLAARCITWISSMVLVIIIAVSRNDLSSSLVCMSLIVSWFISSAYLIWRFHSIIRDVK